MVLTFLQCWKIHFYSFNHNILFKIDISGAITCNTFSVAPSTINDNVKMPCSIELNQKHFCDKHSSLATEKVLLDRPVDVPAWRHDIQHNDTQHNDT